MVCPGCGAPDDHGCYKNCPEVVKQLEENRRLIDLSMLDAASARHWKDAEQNASRLLWAAVMSNGGSLRIHDVDIAAFSIGDYVTTMLEDAVTRTVVLTARRRDEVGYGHGV